ncbi:hypothetical protein, partial [Mycobacterium pseudoshottsii]|uniref:hypothetical protein n=1 Tax=Mycobacterium pseudoshottsii TaxID=265949 RepID=UPI001041CE36
FDRQPPPRPPQSTIPQLTSLLINNAGALVIAPSGAAEVTLTTHPAGFNRTFRLQRHVPARS